MKKRSWSIGCWGQLGARLLLLPLVLVIASTARGALPGYDQARPSPGVALFQRHQFAEATAEFTATLRSDPANLEALTYLGRIAFEENRLEEAAKYFEKLTTIAPRSSEAFHWLGRAYGVQARDLGPPRGIGPAWRTKKALEKAVELKPDNVEARLDLATYYRQAPGIVGGSKRAALGQVEEIKRRDGYLGALVQGDLAMDDKQYAEAERYYQAALAQQPKKTEAYFRLGLLHQRPGQFEQAFAAFEKMLALDPEDKRALFQIGKTADMSWQRLERGAQALEAYLQCQPFYIMPKLAWAHRRLGNIYLKRGLRDAARGQYVAALKADPNDAESASELKRLEEAIKAAAASKPALTLESK